MSKSHKAAWLLLVMLVTVGFAASPVMSAAKVHYHWAPTDLHATPCTRTDCDQATIWRGGEPNPQIIGGGTDGTWVAMPAPTTQPDRMCSANPYDIANNKVYMIGGDPAGGYGIANCQRFDPITNTWTNLADMPGPRTWLDGEGSYCRQRGKIYIAGGYDGSARNNMWEYDIATNTWTSKATMPSATLAYQSGIWRDSLIYILGGTGPGLNGSNVVQIYNVNQNTWTTGTAMPEAGDMGSGTIVGDTIYITNSYNRTTGALWANARKGAINPANPTQITWSTWTAVPTLGFNGGTTQCQGWIYRLGGFGTLTVGSQHKRGWRYHIATGAFETLPWLPSPPTTGVARCNFLSHADATNEIFKLAGDDEGNWSTPNNTYYRNQFTPPIDVGVSRILVPSSPKLQIGVPIYPKVEVKNYGLTHQYNFPVTFRVDSAGTIVYEDAMLIDTLLSGAAKEVEFTIPWTPNCELWGGYLLYSFTVLPGDPLPNNDTVRMFTVNTVDTIYSYRSSNLPTIDGYIAPGEWNDAYLVNVGNVGGWEGVPYPVTAGKAWFKHDGNYLYAAYAMPLATTRDPGDQIGFYCDENNDGQWATDNSEGNYWYWVNGSNVDEVLYRPITPSGPGTAGVAPGAQVVTGTFNGYLVFETRTPFGVLPYQLNLNPANDTCRLWLFQLDGSKFYGWWPVGMPSDSWLVPMMYGTLILKTLQTGDVGVKSIDAPQNARPGDAVVPKATWKNYGTTPMTFTAYYLMNDPTGTRVYSQSQSANLAGGAEIQLTFPSHTVNIEGDWAVKCSTVAGGDVNPANDIKTGSFRVSTAPPWPYGWREVKSIPGAAKDGAFLATNPENGLIYAARGNKSGDFYAYDPSADTMGAWTALTSWPNGTEGKAPSKGANGCYGGGYIWAVKGNNTLGFWRYSVATNNWEQLTDVPMGASGKKIKGGSDMVYVVEDDIGYVYLLKGYKTDFFRYNTATSAWESLPAAPAGTRPKWDKGSWMVYDGQNTLYAHKAKVHELWTFDLTTDQWGASALSGMPVASGKTGKNKKAKDGSDGAYCLGYIYALKGGNTCEWWRYNVAGNAWTELDPMPEVGSTAKKKRVKGGGALAGYGDWAFFALKGAKTMEFWRYVDSAPVFAQAPQRSGVTAEKVAAGRFGFTLTPNPVVRGYGLLSYSVPQQAEAQVRVYDVTGRDVVHLSFVASGTGTRSLDLRHLAAGVYLVRFESAGYSASQKLIVR